MDDDDVMLDYFKANAGVGPGMTGAQHSRKSGTLFFSSKAIQAPTNFRVTRPSGTVHMPAIGFGRKSGNDSGSEMEDEDVIDDDLKLHP